MQFRSLAATLFVTVATGACANLPDDGPSSTAQAVVIGPNLLGNAGVDAVGPNGPNTFTTLVGNAPSAADVWRTRLDSAGFVLSDLQASTLPASNGGSGSMLHVRTNVANSGVFQAWDTFDRGPESARVSVWVYVNVGTVGVGVGPDGAVPITLTTATQGQWINLTGLSGGSHANRINIYSVGGAADFFVEATRVYTDNLLDNHEFSFIGPAGSPVFVATPPGQPFGGGASAADAWHVWMNASGSTFSELLGSTLPVNRECRTPGRMLHVRTSVTNSGIGQIFHPVALNNNGPSRTLAAAWVYVLSGQVGIGTGNGGNTSIDTTTAPGQLNQWVRLSASNGVAPANQFIVYSANGPADFYVDCASVIAVP